MTRRIAGIVFVYICTVIAWFILGGTLVARTEEASTVNYQRLGGIWGSDQSQTAPSGTVSYPQVDAKKTVTATDDLALLQSRINVAFDLEPRLKGLLWFSTYRVDFTGAYRFRSDSPSGQATIQLPFPAKDALYDEARVTLGGKPVDFTVNAAGIGLKTSLRKGQTVDVAFAYRSRGTHSWTYQFGDTVARLRDFSLHATTNFSDLDFSPNSTAPTAETQTASGWDLTWTFREALNGSNIGIVMPEKLQPGPIAQRLTFWAPVALFFYFFLIFIIVTLRNVELHPMNYFFLAAAFFSFHLLFAYIVDRLPIAAAFTIAAVVSIGLVVSYLRLVVGMRFAVVEGGIAQFVYLVMFSYALLFEGWSGLAITIGAIVTLFIVMQLTGRVRWSERFSAAPR